MQPKATQPATQSNPALPTEWHPPRGSGFRFFTKPNRPSPFFFQWRDPDAPPGSRSVKMLAFPTPAARERFAKQKLSEFATFGPSVLASCEPAKLATWRKFEEIVGPDVDPVTVAFEWKQFKAAKPHASDSITITKLVEKYRAARNKDGKSAEAIRHQRLHHNTLASYFAETPIGRITPDDIRAWLGSLVNSKTGQRIVSNVTKKDYRKSANALFTFADHNGFLLKNPVLAVKPPAVVEDDVVILTPEQTARLFAINKAQPCIGRLALEAFAGFRYSSAARLRREHINFEDRGVELPAALHKSRRRKYVEGHPDNLWAWLKHAPADCWDMTERQYLKEKSNAFIRAGIENPGNCLRKGFCSYHLAAYRNATLTAFLLQHRSPTMLYAEYNGVATQAQGFKVFSILPS